MPVSKLLEYSEKFFSRIQLDFLLSLVDFFGISGFDLGGGGVGFGFGLGSCLGVSFGEAVFVFGLAVVCRFGFFFQNGIFFSFQI